MDTTSSLIAVVLLLAANGFYVAAEFALVKARSFRIESVAASGSSSARLTLRIQSKLEAYLAACQLGITMASLGLGWVGEPAVASLLEPLFASFGLSDAALHTAAFITGFLIFSSLHIVVGEQVPKTLAIRQPEPVSLWVAYPLHLSYLLVWPLNFLLNRATSAILSLFGVREATHAEVFSGDEIQGLVATSKEHGEIQEQQADMLHNLFEFDRRQVDRVMIPRGGVHVLDISASADENLAVIRDTEHSRFPLVDSRDDDAIVGIVLAKDIHRGLLHGREQPWRDLNAICRQPLVVPETQQVAQLFEQMRSERAHLALVIDEYGVFVGIVTLEDLLEEIVGEIHDETDEEEAHVDLLRIDDATWEAGGLVSLGDLGRTIGLDVPVDIDAKTLSGLFMQHLARVPEVGDQLDTSGFHLEVLEIEEHRVGRARIVRLPESVTPDAGDVPLVPDARPADEADTHIKQ
ncbi:MAG: HlyC/CorC family transporter [Gammaproteobacteria bacterium]|nr:HlyC/CorC family transporter [Gammaproteobacteria bacterium]